MKGQKVETQQMKDLKRTRKLIQEHPDLIIAEEGSYTITDKLEVIKGIIRIGHLNTLKHMIMPLESLPLTPEFLRQACKAFESKKTESYNLFSIIT